MVPILNYRIKEKREVFPDRINALDSLRDIGNRAIFVEVYGLNGGSRKVVSLYQKDHLEGKFALVREGDGKDVSTIILGVVPSGSEVERSFNGGELANYLEMVGLKEFRIEYSLFLDNIFVRRKLLFKRYHWTE